MNHTIIDLVYEAKNNSKNADILIKNYIPFIKSEAYKVVGHIITDSCDELSIAMIGFHEAIDSYNRLKGSFLNYSSVIMKRKLIDYYRKEKRHLNQISLDENIDNKESEGNTILDNLEDPKDEYNTIIKRVATNEEILELKDQLKIFGLSLTDIADSSPKQNRTLVSCWKIIDYVKNNRELIDTILETKKLPVTKLSLETGVSKKIIDK